eukprot:NODE_34_length_36538_cov_0.612854.p6 type:complete len:565 gc:universal NODE_34_length_36538_cov_0.612854:10850-9156(-)
MSHLFCSQQIPNDSPNIYYTSDSLTIVARSGSDIPTRLDISPWNKTCINVPYSQITQVKVKVLDCSYYDPTFLISFTQVTTLDLEFVNSQISQNWLNINSKLTSLTLRNVNGYNYYSFLVSLCSSANYSKLKVLRIDNLVNTRIPSCVFQNNKLSLNELEISNSVNITFGVIDKLINVFGLKKLNLTNNQLTEFPTNIQPSYLQILDVSKNKFTSLDDNVFPQLLELYAGHNYLTHVPIWFYLGDRSDVLDLSYNLLDTFEASPIFLNAKIDLSGNSDLLNKGKVDCTHTFAYLIMDNLVVNSVSDIVSCANNLRFRNLSLKSVKNLRAQLSGKTLDFAFSPSTNEILTELCQDSGIPKSIVIGKNSTLPAICTSNPKGPLYTVKLDYLNCGGITKLSNLTSGIWSLTCINESITYSKICLKYAATTTFRPLFTSTTISTRSVAMNRTNSYNSTSTRFTRTNYNIASNHTATNTTHFNYTNSTLSMFNNSKTDSIEKFHFWIIEESTSSVSTSYQSSRYLDATQLRSTQSQSFSDSKNIASVTLSGFKVPIGTNVTLNKYLFLT